jgi:hypothetical protein
LSWFAEAIASAIRGDRNFAVLGIGHYSIHKRLFLYRVMTNIKYLKNKVRRDHQAGFSLQKRPVSIGRQCQREAFIQTRHIRNCSSADPAYGEGVGRALRNSMQRQRLLR